MSQSAIPAVRAIPPTYAETPTKAITATLPCQVIKLPEQQRAQALQPLLIPLPLQLLLR
jgi:hypothetical protein